MTDLQALRLRYKPLRLRVAFIGESPPSPNGGEQRFFYLPRLDKADNLFRGIVLALYGVGRDDIRGRKTYWLNRFRDDGFWLLDVALEPINGSPPSARREAIRQGIPRLVDKLISEQPREGIIICKSDIYAEVSRQARLTGIRVLHDRPISFPLGNVRAEFARNVRTALGLSDL